MAPDGFVQRPARVASAELVRGLKRDREVRLTGAARAGYLKEAMALASSS